MSTEKEVRLKKYFEKHRGDITQIVPYDKKKDKIYSLDFSASNTELNAGIVENTEDFSEWIREKLASQHCRYGIGGYNEHRTIYSRSSLFDSDEEPRRLHLGVDIWGPQGTAVFSPLNGKIHSFGFNDNFGDYGATLILKHEVDGIKFHSLYGHLSLASIANIQPGTSVTKSQKIAEFGDCVENGHWPPHLHFQLIFNMQDKSGDYPGVCCYSEKENFLSNCPDPNMILKYTFGY